MRLYYSCALAALLWSSLGTASDDKKSEKKLKPCTIRSPSDRFFDLNPISVQPGKAKDSKSPAESWHAKGYDYPANFTLNFCGPVVEELKDVEDVDKAHWGNVSAFYVSAQRIGTIEAHVRSAPGA